MTKTAEIMVVSPHPDDAEFEAGGTIAGWTREGKQIVYVVCTNGDKGTSDRNLKPEQLADIREKEQRAAAEILGVQEVIFLRFPDQQLEDTPAFRKEIVRQIRRYKPTIVMTADPYRRYINHRDHRITGQVVLDAVYPYARDHLAYPGLLSEGLEPHKVQEILFWASETVDYHNDITDTFDQKVSALCCHESQMGMYPYPLLEDWLKQQARVTAEGKTYELGEAFHQVKV